MNRFLLAAPARVALIGATVLGLGGGLTVASSDAAHAASASVASGTSVSSSAGRGSGISAAQGTMVVRVASSKAGTPYRWGGNGPSSFDCSGLTSWAMRRIGKSIPRTADDQYRATRHIGRASARPGDLVFYGSGYKYHVGIYAGNGRMWHAPHTGDVVKLAPVRGGAAFGRVL